MSEVSEKLKKAFEGAGREQQKDVILYVRVTPPTAKVLESLAKEKKLSRSEVIRILLETAIDSLAKAG